MTHLPDSIGELKQLTYLKFGAVTTSGCNSILTLPKTIGQCTSLRELDMTKCKFLKELPEELGNLSINLHELNLRECKALTALPSSIGNLIQLHEISLSKCTGITVLPLSMKLLMNLERLNLSKCTGLTTESNVLGSVIRYLSSLQILNMRGCKNILSFSELEEGDLPSLVSWDLRGCKKLQNVPVSIKNLKGRLKNLDVRQCPNFHGVHAHVGLAELVDAGCTVLKDEAAK